MSANEPTVYLVDRFVPASQASLAIYDLGIVLGATVTDMTRTFRHQPFRLRDHIERFYRSCRYTRIHPPFDRDRMEAVSRQVVDANTELVREEQELGLIHFITPGPAVSYAGRELSRDELKPTLCIHSFPLPFEQFAHLFREGAHVVTPSIRHLPPVCVDSKIKHRSRMHQWLAGREVAQIDPQAVILFLDLEGNVSECEGSNFLIVRDGCVISPTSRNILGGVSLLTVRELCADLDIPFKEKNIQVYDVMNADEAMLSTTPYCLAPVTKINGAPIGSGEVQGPVFQALMQAWNRRVGVDIVGQILATARV